MRPKVLLAIDRPDWAFAHIANKVQYYLSNEFEFIIRPYPDIVSGDADILVVFWWHSAPILRANVKPKKVILCIYDGCSWTSTNTAKHLFKLAYQQSDIVAVANENFAQMLPYNTLPICIIEDGVDTDLFRPSKLPDKFILGWAGNSDSTRLDNKTIDLKGLQLIRSACAEANIMLALADCNKQLIPFGEMPLWYNKISAYICASLVEGTPNPILEAMACGRPVITTDVGIVRRLVINDRNGYIVPRTVEGIVEAINNITKSDIKYMGAAARVAAEAHDWKHKILAWRSCLWSALEGVP